MSMTNHPLDASSVDESIAMLETHLDLAQIAPLIAVLRELAKTPEDAALVARLSEVFAGLGVLQGAVLTYAPAIGALLSDDPFAD
jgi:hypothetical protein